MTQETGQDAIEPVSIVLPGVDPDRLMLAGVDVSVRPRYTISEVSKSFFELSRYWVRWCDDKGVFDVEEVDPETGQVVKREIFDRKPPIRVTDPETGEVRERPGARSFTLAHLELMVHALASSGRIDGEQAARALSVVYGVARVHGYLPDVVGAERQARIRRQELLRELHGLTLDRQRVQAEPVRDLVHRLVELEEGA